MRSLYLPSPPTLSLVQHEFVAPDRVALCLCHCSLRCDAPQPWVPALGDLDGDGTIDLVQGRADAILVRHGRGDGRFQECQAQLPCEGLRTLCLGDIDGDSDLDICVGTEHGIEIWHGSVAGS